MNRYIERVQSVLQSGTPDNDILVYWPVFDLWDDPQGMMQQLTVHDVRWLTDRSAGRLARALQARGYGFDYISDAQLALTTMADGQLATPGARYRVLLVPAARRMPAATLAHILRLAGQGATVVFESLPEDVPGFGRLAERRAEFRALLGRIVFAAAAGRDEARDRTGPSPPRRHHGRAAGIAGGSGSHRRHGGWLHSPGESAGPRLLPGESHGRRRSRHGWRSASPRIQRRSSIH